MVGVAAAVRVVAEHGNIALVIEESVQHMQRLACGRRNQLGVEGRVAIRDVRVDLEPRLLAIMRVETTGVASRTASLEKLTVGRRGDAAAKHGRERLALLSVDQTLQRERVSLLADMPV